MAVQAQIHLRYIQQVLVEASGTVGLAQALAVDQAAIGAGAAEAWQGRWRPQPLQYVASGDRLDAIGTDQQVAAVVAAVGEHHAGFTGVLLDAGGALVEAGDAWR
ncbi:hypothetical protein D3C76_1517650 [compost metagenome]